MVRGNKAEDNLGLVWDLAKKFVSHGRLEDSQEFSDGCLGLVRAEQGFKKKISKRTGKPIKFSTYAYHCIWHEMIRGKVVRDRCREGQIIDTNWVESKKDDELDFELEEVCGVLLSDLDITERERQIFMEYLNGVKQTELAKFWGISKERVRQLIFVKTIPHIQEKHETFIRGLI
ncbi:unnamed protein product [marine sediment metagenome]|uniref:RNA polymerase sigma-70 region 4 domain-containing protein n=1 Tax=marine sediment metagenome TaxID=412755 RepID=X0T013_9ZZZZ